MPIIQHTLYNAISQKPLQEAGGGRKILELFLPIWRQFENNFLLQFDDNWLGFDFFILLNCDWAQFHPPSPHFGCFRCSNRYNHALRSLVKVGFLIAFRESEVSLNFCPLWAINRSFVCIGDWVLRQKKRLFKIGNLRLFCLFGCKEQRLVAQLHPYMSPTLHLRNFVFSLEKYFRVRLLSRRNKGWNKNKTNISLSIFIRVSHFYTFFELSLVLLTTQAHGL